MNTINLISFKKKVIGEFKVTKLEGSGKAKTIPVQVVRLEEGDYKDYFTYNNIKNINLCNSFVSKKPHKRTVDYVVEKKSNGKPLGLADCKKSKNGIILETIGTSKNPKYCGLGRVLLAGIAKDIKGKCQEISVPTAIPSAYEFYSKCHFDYYDSDYTFYLDEDHFGKLIKDAKKI